MTYNPRKNTFLANYRLRPKAPPTFVDKRAIKIVNWTQKNSFTLANSSQKYLTFPKDFNRLWAALNPFRLGLKPFRFYSPYQSLTPFPYPTHGSFFRAQSRLFIFWYKFSSRKYFITLDFGVKQKKAISETALWFRPSRRGASPMTTFWMFVQKAPTFLWSQHPFSINKNFAHPFWSTPASSTNRDFWFEETLPYRRLFFRNFYDRQSTAGSDQLFLSPSSFDPKILVRKSPLDSSTLWLSSPTQDFSAFIRSFFSNKTVILPERYFQFRLRRQRSVIALCQAFSRLWALPSSSNYYSFDNFVFDRLALRSLDLGFYFNSRISYPLLREFDSLVESYFDTAELTHIAGAAWTTQVLGLDWSKRTVPAFITNRHYRTKFRLVSLFSTLSFYTKHLRRKFYKFPKAVIFGQRLSKRLIRLNRFFRLLFTQFSLKGQLSKHQYLYLLAFIFNQTELSMEDPGRFALATPRWLGKHLRRPKFMKPRHFRGKTRLNSRLKTSPSRARDHRPHISAKGSVVQRSAQTKVSI